MRSPALASGPPPLEAVSLTVGTSRLRLTRIGVRSAAPYPGSAADAARCPQHTLRGRGETRSPEPDWEYGGVQGWPCGQQSRPKRAVRRRRDPRDEATRTNGARGRLRGRSPSERRIYDPGGRAPDRDLSVSRHAQRYQLKPSRWHRSRASAGVWEVPADVIAELLRDADRSAAADPAVAGPATPEAQLVHGTDGGMESARIR
jgi:hypothetical protein